jgi:HD superfamily phosphohydrolase
MDRGSKEMSKMSLIVPKEGNDLVKINLSKEDLKDLKDAGLSRYVMYDWVFPHSVFEIIGRLGYKGTWIFRSLYDYRWYGTHTLKRFVNYDEKYNSLEVELRWKEDTAESE